MESTLNLSEAVPAYDAFVPHRKPRISALEAMEEQDLSQVTILQSPSVVIATKHNTEESAPSIRTWIKSTSWRVTYGNTQEIGSNAF